VGVRNPISHPRFTIDDRAIWRGCVVRIAAHHYRRFGHQTYMIEFTTGACRWVGEDELLDVDEAKSADS
jgi:hypothetical protein